MIVKSALLRLVKHQARRQRRFRLRSGSGVVVVDANDFVVFREQPFTQVRAEKSGTAGHQYPVATFHRPSRVRRDVSFILHPPAVGTLVSRDRATRHEVADKASLCGELQIRENRLCTWLRWHTMLPPMSTVPGSPDATCAFHRSIVHKRFGRLAGGKGRFYRCARSHAHTITPAAPLAGLRPAWHMSAVIDADQRSEAYGMAKPVRKAVLPVAGLGSRFRPARKAGAQGDAASGRQAAHPVCGGGGASCRNQAVHLRHRLIFVTGRVRRRSKNISIATRNSLGICGARGRSGAGARRGAGGRDRLLWDCRGHARGGANRRALRHGGEARSGRDVVAACAHEPLRPAARCLRAACGAVARRHASGEIQLTDVMAAMEQDAPLTLRACVLPASASIAGARPDSFRQPSPAPWRIRR